MSVGYTFLEKIKIRLGQYSMSGNRMIFENPEENPKLEMLIEDAISSIRKVRNYPHSWSEEQIQEDLKSYEDVVIKLVVYDYNKEGMEFENAHTESGVTRQFSSRARVMGDVVPFVDMFST